MNARRGGRWPISKQNLCSMTIGVKEGLLDQMKTARMVGGYIRYSADDQADMLTSLTCSKLGPQ